VRLPLLGRFNVANALGAAACAWGLGVPVESVAERLTAAPQIPGRMERIAGRPCTVLRDYAHTPDALERALETLRPLTTGRLIVVFGAGETATRASARPWARCARASPTSPLPRRTTRAPRIPRKSSTPWRRAWERSPTTARS